MINKIKRFLIKNKIILIFLVIFAVGMNLRFYKIQENLQFGWDQARDAWKTRDILMGHLVLNGPRTGIGHFNLGPLWYYLLAPFYFLTNLDPMGANYFNILINVFNFIVIFYVTRKIFDDYSALFTSLIFATSQYLMEITRTPWNVSPIVGVSTLIFYGIYQIVYKGKYRWIPVVAFLTGFFSHLHFQVIFLPPIILLSLILAKNKMKVFWLGLISLPLFFIWFIPSFLWNLQTKNGNFNQFNNFLKYSLIDRFHLRFFLYRLHDSFIQFQTVLSLPPKNYQFLQFVLPTIFFLLVLFEKNKKLKKLGYLISLWFVVPAFMYAFYGGMTSEYYVLLNAVMVIYVLVYLQKKLLKLMFKPALIILTVVWIFFVYHNTKNYWIKSNYGGLARQKDDTKRTIKLKQKIKYDEGYINAYLYQIWVLDKKK